MVRTALDLTAEELQRYHAGKQREAVWDEARWEQAWDIARAAARRLRKDFGATRVVVFGSLAHKTWFGPSSDVDLAAWGIPDDQYYRAVAAVTGMSPDFEVDLVDPERCRSSMRHVIEQEGIDI